MGLTATATVTKSHPDTFERKAGLGEGWLVTTIWSSEHTHIDRKEGTGYRVGQKHRKLADRLAVAISAGAVFTNPSIKRDVNGKTYVTAESAVIGRRMNADLKRLGF